MMYKITLADGRTINNLELNGSNLISEVKVDENIFTDNLSTLVIEGEGNRYELHDAYLVQQVTYDWDKRWYLCFAEISEEEKKTKADAQLRADVDFISVMTGVDL